jgi:hypothetical protein
MAPGYSKFAKSGNQARDNVYSVRDTGDSRRLRMSLPPIPLDRPERQVLKEGNYVSFKLRAVPTDPESQVYSLSVPYYNSGTPESWILFRKNLDKILIGQNITTGPPTYAAFLKVRHWLNSRTLRPHVAQRHWSTSPRYLKTWGRMSSQEGLSKWKNGTCAVTCANQEH